jgi:predicted transcriptional regulator
MAEQTTKEQIIKAMSELPEDASFEDAIQRLYVLYKIDRGLADVEEGRTLSHEEVKKQLAKWLR